MRLRAIAPATVLALTLGLTACSSSSGGSASTPSSKSGSDASSSTAHATGTVTVLYAGSLVDLMNDQVSPAFKTSTGYTFAGTGKGSAALATAIKGKVYKADVFISASPTVNADLEGTANGDWVSWYVTYASSPLVLGYNPKSKYAAELKDGDWAKVLATPGVRVGTTDPATDPKGKLAQQAMKETPGLQKLANESSIRYNEETLVGNLKSGQLDVGFFYASEAKAAGIPTVPLKGIDLKATYTITVLKDAPNEAGAIAFVKFLLGPAGQAILKQDGYDLKNPPTVSGTGIPAELQALIK